MQVSWRRQSFTGKVLAGSAGIITKALEEAGQQGVQEARSRARVATGTMRDATEYIQRGREVILRNQVPYAASNEFGNARGMSAQPFIRPGHDRMKEVFLRMVKDGFKGLDTLR